MSVFESSEVLRRLPEEGVLHIVVQRSGDDVATLVLSGEVDHHSCARLDATARDLLADGARSVVLDCSAITFLDSGGLRVLLALVERTSRHGGAVTLRRPPPFLERVLEVSGVRPLVVVEPQPVS